MNRTVLLIGSLLVLSLFPGCSPQGGGSGPAASSDTAGHSPMARRGPETWTIDGRAYEISSSYYLALPDGLQFTVEYRLAENEDSPARPTGDAALRVAFPIMKYIVRNNLYKQVDVGEIDGGPRSVSRIGVVLFVQKGGRTSGYRTALSIVEIENRLRDRQPEEGRQP